MDMFFSMIISYSLSNLDNLDDKQKVGHINAEKR